VTQVSKGFSEQTMMPMGEHEFPVKTFGKKWIDMAKKNYIV
jgi:hypothetical protein